VEVTGIVVVGGSVAGLTAALALARDGHRVTVLERDATPLPESPVAAFESWERRGAPQVRHSHAFLARLRNLLRDRAPDLLAALLAAGAEELPFGELLPPTLDDPSPRPGDEDLVMLACRRITFEWVLRRQALREPGVAFRDGVTTLGLLPGPAGRSGLPRVAGVRLRGAEGREEALAADLVVDASGRRSRLPEWLAALGAGAPEEHSAPCGIFYTSRFYRLHEGARPPRREGTVAADLGYLKYAVFHGDSRIFSVTFAASPEDVPLRALLRTPGFERTAGSIPATRAWTDPACAEPISDVHGMDGLRSMHRRLLRGGAPLALGVVAVGDAALHTNPLYGRGCTLAVWHAFLLADALREHPRDAEAFALTLDERTQRHLVPWYRTGVRQDLDAAELAEIYRRGEEPGEAPDPAPGTPVDPKAWLRSLVRHGLLPALGLDAVVARRFFRAFNLLDPPEDLLRDPALLSRVLAVYQGRGGREERVFGPRRSEMLELLAA
jgi:2-polyprenyl-6-methoxyphenol hydroxylase-like FAD-dependent oxidoreductase